MTNPAVRQQKPTAGRLTKAFQKWIAAGIAACGLVVFYTGSNASYIGAQAMGFREIRTIKAVETLPFEVTYIDDPTHYKGYTELVSEGVTGEKELEAQILYENGRAVRVVSIKNMQTGTPVNRVVLRGSKVLTTPNVNGQMSEVSFIRPVKTGWISAPIDDYPGHTGVDFAARYGSPVYASAGGTVVYSGWNGDYGKCVILRHEDGSITLYAHNSVLWVYYGQTVKQGEHISNVGSTGNSTGPHLHFEIRTAKNEILDPLIYVDQ